MNTGHATISTIHAGNVQEAINRLINDPINVPVAMFGALDIIIVQSISTISKKRVRRCLSVHEISTTQDGTIVPSPVFIWDPATDTFHSFASVLPAASPLSSFMAENIRSNGEAEYMLFSTEGVPPLENLFENLAYAMVGQDVVSTDVLKATVSLILRYFSEIPECMISAVRHRSDSELLQTRIEEYLRTDFRTATLSELAEKLGLSIPYLSKRIRELCGSTFSRLLQEARFDEAIRLLQETDLPVGDIIIAVGYENTSFFHNQFKERYHCSPLRWRKQQREKN
jgi:AraC-like DNA-binding protein